MHLSKKGILMFAVLFSLTIPVFVQRLRVQPVKGVPLIHQGDLLLQGSNVTVIEGLFDINGSITIQENATLILRNAVLNFTQAYSFQHHMNLQNPVDGNPRLIVDNATMTSAYSLYVQSFSNGSIEGDGLLAWYPVHFYVQDSSLVSLSNSSFYELNAFAFTEVDAVDSEFEWLIGEGDSTMTATNCTIVALHVRENATCTLVDCSVEDDVIVDAYSVNCSMNDLASGVVDYWNFKENSSILVAPGGWAPNVTLLNSDVYRWSFILGGTSNGTVSHCMLMRFASEGSAVISVHNSVNSGWISARDNSSCYIYDTTMSMVESHENAMSWLVNSTYGNPRLYDSGRIYVNWILEVHVVDQLNQHVPSANVTATFLNTTMVGSMLTDGEGWGSFVLMKKKMNASGDYLAGNYTVEATYGVHSNSTSVNMTESQQKTLKLSSFIIPEFPPLITLPLFIAVTLLVILGSRKNTMKSHTPRST